MKKKSFTMMEVMVVLIVIGVIATLGFPAYSNILESSKARVCQANLTALSTALDVYAMEHDALPGDLSQLQPEHIRSAFAALFKERGAWKLKLAYYIVGFKERGLAYAGLLNDLARGDRSLLTCPAHSGAGRSYGMLASLAGMPARTFRNLNEFTVLLGDSDTETFNEVNLTNRHRRSRVLRNPVDYAIGVDRGRRKVRVQHGVVTQRNDKSIDSPLISPSLPSPNSPQGVSLLTAESAISGTAALTDAVTAVPINPAAIVPVTPPLVPSMRQNAPAPESKSRPEVKQEELDRVHGADSVGDRQR